MFFFSWGKAHWREKTQPGPRLPMATKTRVPYIFRSTTPSWGISTLHVTTAAAHSNQMRWAKGKASITTHRMLGNISRIRKYTACKSCPYIGAARLLLCVKLKVEMNASVSAFRNVSFWCHKKQEGPDLSLKRRTFTMRTEGILFWRFLMRSLHFSFLQNKNKGIQWLSVCLSLFHSKGIKTWQCTQFQ